MTQLLKIYIAMVMLICFPSSVLAFQVYYYDTDATGTPIAVVDTNGNQVWKGEYYPFGEERSIQGTPGSNNHRLIGKEKDDETGLTYFDARYMNAGTGRFLTPDPVRPVDEFTSETQYALLVQPQRLNRYAYGLNNPYRYVDSDGKLANLVVGTIGAVIGGAYNYIDNWKELRGEELLRSVGVGIAAGFVAGATGGVGGAVVGAGLNEIHEQTLRGKDITNYDSSSIVTASASGLIAAGAGKTISFVAKEIPKNGGFKFTEPSLSNPIDLTGKTYEKAGNILAEPVSSAVQDKTDKELKEEPQR